MRRCTQPPLSVAANTCCVWKTRSGKKKNRKNKTHVFGALISTNGCLESPNGANLRWENSFLFPPTLFFSSNIHLEVGALPFDPISRDACVFVGLVFVRGVRGCPRLGCGLYSPCAPRPRALGGGIHLNVSPGRRRREQANPPKPASEEQTSQFALFLPAAGRFSIAAAQSVASLTRQQANN